MALWRGRDPGPCSGAIEAHHAGEHAGFRKPPDDTVIPLCDHHHDCLTDRRGAFSGWPKFALKEWELAAVAYYQVRYAVHLAERAADDGLF